jgi:methyltransferase family protein
VSTEAALDRRAVAARALLDDLPKLHDFGRGREVGGLNKHIGERIIAEVSRHDAPRIVETGAGASTLLLLCLEPQSLTSIAPDFGLHERILAEAGERKIPVDRLEFLNEQSELALPRLFALGKRFDVGLIDGCHNWPAVFVDFCYINMVMPAGGTLFIDDVQLYSVKQLYLLLSEQPEYEHVALDGKFATFRKVLDCGFLPEWRSQPYIERNTVNPPSP